MRPDRKLRPLPSRTGLAAATALALALWAAGGRAAPPPGAAATPGILGSTIPKYTETLIIPPAMPKSTSDLTVDYQIAVRQFQQQILPTKDALGNLTNYPATTVWSYGSADHPTTFNYPAFTVENLVNTPTKVKWINDLKDPVTGAFLPHLLPVDQTLHWANPGQLPCVVGMGPTDCRTATAGLYTGPVPLVTHVHGAHVGPESDGYPEAWWLPAGAPAGYATKGSRFSDATGTNPGNLGYAVFNYPNTQRASTIWYHDHALGMTRLNVYAGPAGFWLIRGAAGAEPDLVTGVLPGPGPTVTSPAINTAGTAYEIPLAIQDRSFNANGSLFYPDNRAYFEGQTATVPPVWNLDAATFPFIPNPASDISPIFNPEVFLDTMVVNGRTWPYQNVQPKRYRLRLLNGCNSRTLNLALFVVDPVTGATTAQEIPFYVIGTEGGLLPQVVEVKTGFKTPLPGNGTIPAAVAASVPQEALLMGLAERMDVIVDFTGLAPGTRVRMVNTAPDMPFGGFGPGVLPADPLTTGQVMEFVLVASDGIADPSTAPASLVLSPIPAQPAATATRMLSLNELDSNLICVAGTAALGPTLPYQVLPVATGLNFLANCTAAGGIPFGPKEAQLGTVSIVPGATAGAAASYLGNPLPWMDPVTEVPQLGATETWELYNYTVDAHPIHLHLVTFQVVNRQALDPLLGSPIGLARPPEATEAGTKDTVIAYPGEVTRLQATFDVAGRYVWHCHIVEHEDNEMMRPFDVATLAGKIVDPATGAPVVGATVTATPAVGTALTTTTDATGFYYFVAPAGTYTITVSGAALPIPLGTATTPAPVTVTTTPGSVGVVYSPVITAAGNGILTGNITTGGLPAAGVTVTATDTVTGAVYTAVTDAAGNYTISAPAGSYTITTTKAGFANTTTATPVALTAGATTNATATAITAAANGTLTGTVTAGGAPVVGATVTANPGGYTAVTDATGAYTISAPQGSYTITVGAATYALATTAATNVTSGAATTVAAVALVSATAVNLTGTITDVATGLPVTGVTVTANPGGFTAVTDALGNYTIAVPPGTYTVTTTAVGYVNTSTAAVTIDAAGTITGTTAVAVSPGTPGTVTGTVTDAAGAPVPGATVTVNPGGYTGTTDAAGNYSIPVPPGTYTVVVTATGYTGGTGAGGVTEGTNSDVDVELEATGGDGGGGGGGGGGSSGWCFISSLGESGSAGAPLGARAGLALVLLTSLSLRLVRRRK